MRGTWAAKDASELMEEAVADDKGTVVAHALARRAASTALPRLWPASHRSAWHRRISDAGIGTALMESLVLEAASQHWPLLVLLGDPAFYAALRLRAGGTARAHIRTGGSRLTALPGAAARRRRDASTRNLHLLLGVAARQRRAGGPSITPGLPLRRPARAAAARGPRWPGSSAVVLRPRSGNPRRR